MLDPAFYTAPVILPGPSTVPAVNGQAPSWNTDGTFAGWTSAGLTSGPLSQFAATTSLQLAGVITDETGTGLLVFGTSPTLVTPLIGTPASGVLTNCTGLPLTTGVTGTLGHLNLGSGGGGAIKFLREDSTYQTITLSPPAGTGTELQYRVNATTFGAVPDTFVVGGNIGIGATPLVKFQVNVGTNQNIWLRSSLSNPNISFANDGGAAFVTGSIDGLTLVINAATLGNVGIGAPAVGATLHIHGNTAVLKLTDTGASGHTYWLYPRAGTIAGQFGLYDETAGAYRWLVDSSGNIGFNVEVPSAKVHAVATTEQLRVGYDLSNYYSTTVSSSGGVTFNAVGSGSAFVFSDNVGLGIIPLVKFHVNVGTNQNLWVRSSASNPNISFANDGGAAFVAGSIDGLSLILNGATLGNVGIGIAPSGATLHVAGNAAVLKVADTNASGRTFWLYPRANNVAGQFALYDETIGAYRWLVDAYGNFGVNTLDPSGGQVVITPSATTKPGLLIVGATSHSIPLLRLNMTGLPTGNAVEINLPSGSGGNALSVSAAGYVGIGATTPAGKLDIGGYGTPTVVTVGAASSILLKGVVGGVMGIELKNTDTTGAADCRFAIVDTTAHYLAFSMPGTGNTGSNIFGMSRSSASFLFTTGGTTRHLGIGTLAAKNLVLGTNNAAVITILSDGTITLSDAINFVVNATTGTKWGTATTQKQSWWNAAPVVQPTAVTDASGGAVIDSEVRTALNGLLAKLRTVGLIAT